MGTVRLADPTATSASHPPHRYFNSPYFNGSFVSRTEEVNSSCSWSPLLHSAPPPAPSISPLSNRPNTARAFGWSARWSGFYRPVHTGTTTFYLQHSAGQSAVVVNNVRVGGAHAAAGGSATAIAVVNITSRSALQMRSVTRAPPFTRVQVTHPSED
jgi:hypothetical protein